MAEGGGGKLVRLRRYIYIDILYMYRLYILSLSYEFAFYLVKFASFFKLERTSALRVGSSNQPELEQIKKRWV